MNEKLTMWRFEPPIRMTLLGLGGAAALGTFASGLVTPGQLYILWAGALLAGACLALRLGLERRPRQVPLHDLEVADRKQALELAWRPMDGPKEFMNVAIASVGVGFLLYVLSPLLPLPWLWVLLASTMVPVAVTVWQFVIEHPRAQALALRQAGVGYVRTMYPSWLSTGAQHVGQLTLDRFQQTDPSRAPFVFWLPDFKSSVAPDMPVPFVHLESLAVGEFLGARGGHYIDLKTTSKAHAELPDPDVAVVSSIALGEDTAKVEEREAHYRDVVTVSYKRAGATAGANVATGVFEVSLTNGQTIAFPTLEDGTPVQAALESIRQRTRRAKGAA